jgi:probable HAF family extracellular repeat protein
MQALGTLGSASEADAISSDGTIVGWSTLKSGFRAPFIWTASGGMKQLGTVTNAIALGINSSGQVVGSSDLGLYVPYVWDAKTGSIQNADSPTISPLELMANAQLSVRPGRKPSGVR